MTSKTVKKVAYLSLESVINAAIEKISFAEHILREETSPSAIGKPNIIQKRCLIRLIADIGEVLKYLDDKTKEKSAIEDTLASLTGALTKRQRRQRTNLEQSLVAMKAADEVLSPIRNLRLSDTDAHSVIGSYRWYRNQLLHDYPYQHHLMREGIFEQARTFLEQSHSRLKTSLMQLKARIAADTERKYNGHSVIMVGRPSEGRELSHNRTDACIAALKEIEELEAFWAQIKSATPSGCIPINKGSPLEKALHNFLENINTFFNDIRYEKPPELKKLGTKYLSPNEQACLKELIDGRIRIKIAHGIKASSGGIAAEDLPSYIDQMIKIGKAHLPQVRKQLSHEPSSKPFPGGVSSSSAATSHIPAPPPSPGTPTTTGKRPASPAALGLHPPPSKALKSASASSAAHEAALSVPPEAALSGPSATRSSGPSSSA